MLFRSQFYTHTVYKRLPRSSPAEAAEEESFEPEIHRRNGDRMVEEPQVNLCQPKHGAKALGEERRGGEEKLCCIDVVVVFPSSRGAPLFIGGGGRSYLASQEERVKESKRISPKEGKKGENGAKDQITIETNRSD